MPLTGAGMRRHLRTSNACRAHVGAAESFVSFIPLFGAAVALQTADPRLSLLLAMQHNQEGDERGDAEECPSYESYDAASRVRLGSALPPPLPHTVATDQVRSPNERKWEDQEEKHLRGLPTP
jgi:hypothetical protein